MNIGDKIQKPKGYRFDGVIVSKFTTLKGETRYVCEIEDGNCAGMLHIFSGEQIELRP